MKNSEVLLLSDAELKNINGGFALPLIGLLITYVCAATSFLYNLGKDGKSGASYEEKKVQPN